MIGLASRTFPSLSFDPASARIVSGTNRERQHGVVAVPIHETVPFFRFPDAGKGVFQPQKVVRK
jgi:hypothetical protein